MKFGRCQAIKNENLLMLNEVLTNEPQDIYFNPYSERLVEWCQWSCISVTLVELCHSIHVSKHLTCYVNI